MIAVFNTTGESPLLEDATKHLQHYMEELISEEIIIIETQYVIWVLKPNWLFEDMTYFLAYNRRGIKSGTFFAEQKQLKVCIS